MQNLFYCSNCEIYQETKIIEKEQTFCVKGRTITLTAPVRVCCNCGEEVLDAELDDETLKMFYRVYRKEGNLLQPEEIRRIRNKYHLSQASFSKFLGFGEKTITRYENGALQDVCHDNAIRLMDSLESFSILWKVRKDCLSPREQQKIGQIMQTYNRLRITSSYYLSSAYCPINNHYYTEGVFENAG